MKNSDTGVPELITLGSTNLLEKKERAKKKRKNTRQLLALFIG